MFSLRNVFTSYTGKVSRITLNKPLQPINFRRWKPLNNL